MFELINNQNINSKEHIFMYSHTYIDKYVNIHNVGDNNSYHINSYRNLSNNIRNRSISFCVGLKPTKVCRTRNTI